MSTPNPTTLALPNVPQAANLQVVSFLGREGVSDLFAFEVDLLSSSKDLAFGMVMGEAATLTLTRESGSADRRVIQGMVAEVQQGGAYDPPGNAPRAYFYRFRIVPRLWRLTLSQRSRVFRRMKLPDLIEDVLTKAGFTKDTDFKVKIDLATAHPGAYPPVDYRAQYRESDYAFLCRVLEEAGVHFYFEHVGGKDIVVFADQNPAGTDRYLGEVALSGATQQESTAVITHLGAHQRMVPTSVHVADADFARFPSVQAKAEDVVPAALVDPPGAPPAFAATSKHESMVVQEFVEASHATPPLAKQASQADASAENAKQTRAHGLDYRARLARERSASGAFALRGEGTAVTLAAGYAFAVTGNLHREDMKRERYFLTGVRHGGLLLGTVPEVASRGLASLRAEDAPLAALWVDTVRATGAAYVNAFSAVLNRLPYRPELRTPVPRTAGVMTAPIQPQVPNGEAVLDEEGRYRVRMPFAGDREDSRPVRMAQPYSGPDYGMHFPNPAGAEAVVAFIDGDPNRPVILATVPNPIHHTPVPTEQPAAGHNEKQNVIRSRLGHTLILDDQDGSENAAITLKVASHTDNPRLSKSDDTFYSSTIRMGGTSVEDRPHVLGLTQAQMALDLANVFRDRDVVGVLTRAISASAVAIMGKGESLGDAWIGKSSVGVDISTLSTVSVSGAGGVTISAPLVFGQTFQVANDVSSDANEMFSGVVNLVLNSMIKSFIGATLDELAELKEKGDKADPLKNRILKYEVDKGGAKLVSSAWEAAVGLIGASGIDLKSGGSINLLSMISVKLASLYQDIEMLACGKVDMKAGAAVGISSNEGVTIKTTGKQEALNDREPIKTVKSIAKLAGNSTLLDSIQQRWANFTGFPEPFPITIENETGRIEVKAGEGAISLESRVGADKKQTAVDKRGGVMALAQNGPVVLGAGLDGKKQVSNGCVVDAELGVALYAKDKPVVLQSGKSAIVLHPNGHVVIHGEKVSIIGKDAATLAAGKVTVAGDSTLTMGLASTPNVAPVPAAAAPKAGEKATAAEVADELVKSTRFRDKEPPAVSGVQEKLEFAAAGATLKHGQAEQSWKSAGDVEAKGLNITLDSKVKSKIGGTMVELDAKGLASLKGALSKIG